MGLVDQLILFMMRIASRRCSSWRSSGALTALDVVKHAHELAAAPANGHSSSGQDFDVVEAQCC